MKSRRMTAWGVLVAMALGMLVAVVPASASVQGRRNTAWGLTGLAAIEALTGHGGAAVVVGAGAAYAWKREQDARRAEQWSNRYGYGYSPYYNGYYGRGYRGYGTYYYRDQYGRLFYYDQYGRPHYVSQYGYGYGHRR